jgi:uncharacterized membrane protein YdjX (TVP38/TMEM64 family)
MSCGGSLAMVFAIVMTAAVIFYTGRLYGDRHKDGPG